MSPQAITETKPRSDEYKRVHDWRLTCLRRAGVETTAAEALADDLRVDLHEALAMSAAGCSDELLLSILS